MVRPLSLLRLEDGKHGVAQVWAAVGRLTQRLSGGSGSSVATPRIRTANTKSPGSAGAFCVSADLTLNVDHAAWPLARRRQHHIGSAVPGALRGSQTDQAALDVVATPVAQHACGFVVLHPF